MTKAECHSSRFSNMSSVQNNELSRLTDIKVEETESSYVSIRADTDISLETYKQEPREADKKPVVVA